MVTFSFRPHDEIDKRINYLEEKFGNCITLVDEQSRIKSSIEITGPLVEIIIESKTSLTPARIIL